MALTPSNMIPLGTVAPDFQLPDGNNKIHTRDNLKKDNGLLITFICNHCPYVKHLNAALAELGHRATNADIGMAAISANDIENYPEDAPAKMLEEADRHGYPFAYLYDETQQIAKSYDAACTPDFYLFDKSLKLVYRGQFDDSRPGNNLPVTGKDLYDAIDCMVNGKAVPENQKPSVGCNIKWK